VDPDLKDSLKNEVVVLKEPELSALEIRHWHLTPADVGGHCLGPGIHAVDGFMVIDQLSDDCKKLASSFDVLGVFRIPILRYPESKLRRNQVAEMAATTAFGTLWANVPPMRILEQSNCRLIAKLSLESHQFRVANRQIFRARRAKEYYVTHKNLSAAAEF
jgi:hypothetical protein